MDWWRTILRHVVAPAWAWWEQSPYLRHYRQLQRRQFDPPEVVHRRQWQAVADLLHHAYATTPFWRDQLDRQGIRPDQVRSFEDFRAIPVLTKELLRSQAAQLVSDRFRDAYLHRKKTSGSTGVSVEVLVDEAAQQWKRACTLRSDEWSGWRFGEPVAKVWGNPEYLQHGWRGWLRNRLLDRARYLDTLQMDDSTLGRFARSLRRQPPALLFGHAHSLYLLAEYLRARGGAGFRPRGVIATAMTLHSWERQTIEEVFACQVTNRYGCEEVSLIACECEQHAGLHINADGVYVEVLRPDGSPAQAGEVGAVIVTDLANRAMPLLRYQVGDLAVPSGRHCPCGRGLPLLERVEGRVADYVVAPDGKLISGISLTENLALLVPGIAQFQIVQESLTRFRFRIVRGPLFGPRSLERLRQLVSTRFGAQVEFTCEYLDRIPREASGKYRFCVSKVTNPYYRLAEAVAPCSLM